MEIRISNLKTEFNNISLVRSKIISVFDSLKNKSDKLKMIYTEFIKNSNTQLFVFGLDSFHFQSKLIDLEYDDMKRIFLFVNNRMYCEYFKLYKIISSYVIENVTDKKILEIIKSNNFPVYKDVEPFKDYKFENTLEIHENILVLLNSIASIINNRENELSIHRSKQLIGLNIDNFVNSFNYEITLMREKVNLFLSYIEFFHRLHAKYLKRLSNKIQLMFNHINTDIQFDENAENNKNANINDNENLDILDEQHNEIIDNNNLNFNVVIDNSDNKNIFFDDNQSGLNSPSNSSYKSTESHNKSNKKMKLPKFIKNGIKKVNNMINSCNIKSISDSIVSDYNELELEKLSVNNCNEKLIISLNDFNDNVTEIENKTQQEEETLVVDDSFNNNEKETQTGLFYNENIAVEEPEVPAVEEAEVLALEEPEVPAVEEPEAPAVEEPEAPAVEEPEVPAVEEPEAPAVEEPEALAVEESEVPAVEEPEAPAVEEPEAPAVEEPEAPALEEPEAPAVEEPEAPAVEEPEAPALEEPEAPAVEEPEAPAVEEPEAPAVE